MRHRCWIMAALVGVASVGCATAGGAAEVGRRPWTSDSPPGFEGMMNRESHRVYLAAVRALTDEHLHIDHTDPGERFVIAHAYASLVSWGEVVSVYLRRVDANRTMIRVDSRPRLATNVFARDHTDAVIAAIERELRNMPESSATDGQGQGVPAAAAMREGSVNGP